MSFLRLVRGFFPSKATSSGQFGAATMLTCTSVGVGWLLDLWLGTLGFYLSLLGCVAAVTWTGGLWPSLFSQVLGAVSTLFIKTYAFSAFSTTDLQVASVFFLSAEMLMFLLLSIQANRDLQLTSRRLEVLVQSTHDALWDWDLGTNYNWKEGKTLHGFNYEAGKAKHNLDWWLKRVHPSDVNEVWAGLRRALDGAESQWSHEYRLRRNNGSYAIVADHGFIVRNEQGIALRMFGGLADISEQRAAEERFVQSTVRDKLTGLFNRESFLDHFHFLLEKQRYRNESSLAVLLIDIDGLKAVNQSFGHNTGDRLLITVAARLVRCLREEDAAARFGGDEFTVLLNHIEPSSEVIHVVKRIQQSLSAPFEIQGQVLRITVSIGISFAEYASAERAIQEANSALQRAKVKGYARFEVFGLSSNLHSQLTREDERELRRSLHEGSLQLYYQPIVSLHNGRTFGVEALLRWRHPRKGFLAPLEILYLAENTGLTLQLGQSVLQQACLCLDRWKQSSQVPASLVMSLNFSREELMRPTLLEEMRELLNVNNLSSNALQIEVTEATIAGGDIAVRRKLKQLRDLGLCIALDDFGRGCSSLGRLQQFPISMVKIDGLLTRQAGTENSHLLDAILAAAEKLKLQIVAEQVETTSQLRHLEACGSSMAQGFVFSQPVPEQKAFELLKIQTSWKIASPARSSELLVSRGT